MRWRVCGELFMKWAGNIFIAPITIAKTSTRLDNSIAKETLSPETGDNVSIEEKSWIPLGVATSFFFYGFVVFHFAQLGNPGMWSVAWVMYICFVGIVTSIRLKARDVFKVWPLTLLFSVGFLFENSLISLDYRTILTINGEEIDEAPIKGPYSRLVCCFGTIFTLRN